MNRGYYQTAKLVEAHKVTNGLPLLPALPTPKKNTHPMKPKELRKRRAGIPFSEVDKDGTNGKQEKQEPVNSVASVKNENSGNSHVFGERTNSKETVKENEANKQQPIFCIKELPRGEKCEACGALAVTKQIITPQKDILRHCENCYQALKRTFTSASFQPSFPDIHSRDNNEAP